MGKSSNNKDISKPTAVKKKKKSKQSIKKDPSDVLAYLETWKNNHSAWKFNKNTQSWLLRHMYHADKLNKQGFAWMTEYLQKGPEGLRQRVIRDATRRALRYQDFEKNGNTVSKKSEEEGDKVEGEMDEWQKLSDQEKRKEYKRARKVLEVVAAVAPTESPQEGG